MDKFYDQQKRGLFSFGYLEQDYLQSLQKLTQTSVDKRELDIFVQSQLSNRKALFFYYDIQNEWNCSNVFNDRTFIKAVDTGYKNSRDKKILAYSVRNKNVEGSEWSEIRFATQNKLYNIYSPYWLGKLRFDDYNSANKFIISLHEELLPGEKWSFREGEDIIRFRKKTKYEILESYISETFSKVLSEYDNISALNYKKLLFSTDKDYSIFNTGLLDKYGLDVYIVVNMQNAPYSYSIQSFLSNPQPSELHEMNFPDALPDIVTYFEKIEDIIFNSKVPLEIKHDTWEHIIKDGVKRGRFPEEYEKIFYQGNLRKIAEDIKQNVDLAIQMAKRNYKYIVPQYRPQEKAIQFLMPIYLNGYSEDCLPNFALVIGCYKKDGKLVYYTAHTVLPLSWAYSNARLICKPDDSWLRPTEIHSEEPDEPAQFDVEDD